MWFIASNVHLRSKFSVNFRRRLHSECELLLIAYAFEIWWLHLISTVEFSLEYVHLIFTVINLILINRMIIAKKYPDDDRIDWNAIVYDDWFQPILMKME